MDLLAPFTGVLYLPDKQFLVAGTPVLLADGTRAAVIMWHGWTQRFEVTDPAGTVLAECRPRGFLRRRYTALGRDGRVLIDLLPGGWRLFNGAELTIGTRLVRIHQPSMWSDRRFEFYDGTALIGRITPTTGSFSFRPDSYAFELLAPAMSVLEAVCLAQALREVARASRSSSS